MKNDENKKIVEIINGPSRYVLFLHDVWKRRIPPTPEQLEEAILELYNRIRREHSCPVRIVPERQCPIIEILDPAYHWQD